MLILRLACVTLLLSLAPSSAFVARSLYDACSLTCGCMHKVGSELEYQMGEMKITLAEQQSEMSMVRRQILDASNVNVQAIRSMEMESKNFAATLAAEMRTIKDQAIAGVVKSVSELRMNGLVDSNSTGMRVSPLEEGKYKREFERLKKVCQAEKELLGKHLLYAYKNISAANDKIKSLEQHINGSFVEEGVESPGEEEQTEREVEELKNQLDFAKQNITYARQRIKVLEVEVENMEEARERIKKLEGQVEDGEREIQRLHKEAAEEVGNNTCIEDDTAEKIKDLEEQLETAKMEKEELIHIGDTEKSKLEEKLKEVQEEAATAKERFKELEEELKNATAEAKTMKMMAEERPERNEESTEESSEELVSCEKAQILEEQLERTKNESEIEKISLERSLEEANQTASEALERASMLEEQLNDAILEIELTKNASGTGKLELERNLHNAQKEVHAASEKAKALEKKMDLLLNETEELKNTTEYEKQTLQQDLEDAQEEAAQAMEKLKELEDELEKERQEIEQLEIAVNLSKIELAHQAVCRKARQLNLVSLNSKKYLFDSHNRMNWTEGKKFCEEKGLRMAAVESQDELDALFSAAKKIDRWPWWWVAASDIGQKAGDFMWLDGNPLPKNSTLWYGEHPNSFSEGNATCVYFFTGLTEKLLDYACTDANCFICELPSECL